MIHCVQNSMFWMTQVCYLRETFGTGRNIEHWDLYGFEINSFHLSKWLREGIGIEKYLH